MPVQLKNILEALNQHAPFSLAESWDNVGLLVGNPEQEITGILTALDPTNNLIDEAITKGANLIVTHHPVIFKPLKSINTGLPGGRLLEKALSNQIAIVGYHTNFDSAKQGINDVLAEKLGLIDLVPLVSEQEQPEDTGLGRIGRFDTAVSGEVFITSLLQVLDLQGVQIAGTLPDTIKRVAVCGGSGSDFAETAFQQGADIYLSAEIKHSTAIWASENNFCIIDGTHYATEKPAVDLLAQKLTEMSAAQGWNTDIFQSDTEHHPFQLLQTTNY